MLYFFFPIKFISREIRSDAMPNAFFEKLISDFNQIINAFIAAK
ncbi:MAG: hypothetical protein ACLQSR_17515 [Limisphaerales bacterium]